MNKVILILFAVFLSASGIRAQTAANIPSGMVAWWRAENNGLDSLAANHGTMHNGASWAAGKAGQAFSFDGVDDYVTAPDSPSWDFGQDDFSIELWINLRQLKNSMFVHQQAGATLGGFTFFYYQTANGLYFNRNPGAPIIGRSWVPQLNRWYHIAVTRTSGTYRLYVDGQQLGTEQFDSNPVENVTGSLRFGSLAGVPGYETAGELDEIAIFRKSLSGGEITSIYNAGSSGKNVAKPYFLTPGPLADGGVGTPYSFQFAAAVTPGPHTFSVVNGTLPPGLELSTNGLLYGTPTAGMTNNFDILATSSSGQTNTHPFSLRVEACLNPAFNPVAWWRGQNDALDAVSTKHGTLVNGVTFAAGKVGQAFNFDGVDDYVQVPITGIPVGNAARTVEFWMKTTALEVRSLFIYGAYSGGSAFYTAVVNSKLVIGEWAGANVSGTKVVTDGLWHHAAMAYDGAGTTRLYVDGTLDAIRSGYSYNTTDGNLYFGGAVGAGPLLFSGLVDEFTIYNRALTLSEVAANYAAGAGGKCGMVYLTSLSPLPGAGQGAAYSQPLAVTGGTEPFTFTLLSDTLPAGLTLSGAGVISGTPTNFGISDFTVRVTDAQTRPADRHFTIKVNARPALPVMANQSVNELALLTVANPGTDADSLDTLTYSLITPPPGVSINAAGTIAWTPTEAQGPGVFTITTQVTDNDTPPLSTTNAFTVTVNEINVAPVLPAQANRSVNELTLLTVANAGTDADLPANGLTYTLTEAPAGAAINATGTITWTPTEAQGPGVFTFTTRVDDHGTPNLSATNTFTVTVNEVNVAPQLTAQADRTINELTLLTINDAGTDADLPANALSWQLTTAPAGATISATGIITWTPSEGQGPGTHPFTVKVTDNGTPPLNATHSFTVTVSEVNTAPVLAALNNVTINPGQTVSFTAAATDTDLPANGLTYTLETPPAGATINASTGQFQWRPALSLAGTTQTITVKVTDNGTPPASHNRSFNVTVNSLQAFTLRMVSFTGGVVQMRLEGPAGPDYKLERSADMVTWETVSQQTPSSMPVDLTNTPAPSAKRLFYRVAAGP